MLCQQKPFFTDHTLPLLFHGFLTVMFCFVIDNTDDSESLRPLRPVSSTDSLCPIKSKDKFVIEYEPPSNMDLSNVSDSTKQEQSVDSIDRISSTMVYPHTLYNYRIGGNITKIIRNTIVVDLPKGKIDIPKGKAKKESRSFLQKLKFKRKQKKSPSNKTNDKQNVNSETQPDGQDKKKNIFSRVFQRIGKVFRSKGRKNDGEMASGTNQKYTVTYIDEDQGGMCEDQGGMCSKWLDQNHSSADSSFSFVF